MEYKSQYQMNCDSKFHLLFQFWKEGSAKYNQQVNYICKLKTKRLSLLKIPHIGTLQFNALPSFPFSLYPIPFSPFDWESNPYILFLPLWKIWIFFIVSVIPKVWRIIDVI